MSLVGSDSLSYSSEFQDNDAYSYTSADGNSTTWGPKLSFAGGGSIGAFTTSDYGALGVAGQIASGAMALGQQAGETARAAIKQAGDIVATKAESDITKFSKPFIWVAVVVGAVLLGIGYFALKLLRK